MIKKQERQWNQLINQEATMKKVTAVILAMYMANAQATDISAVSGVGQGIARSIGQEVIVIGTIIIGIIGLFIGIYIILKLLGLIAQTGASRYRWSAYKHLPATGRTYKKPNIRSWG